MLDLDGPMRHCFSRFPTVHEKWGEGGGLQCQKFHGIFTLSADSRRVCWILTVLCGIVSADFRPFTEKWGEGGRERGRKVSERQEE